MPSGLLLLIIIIVLAVIFDFVNGFHDTANAIATVVATRVLTPMQAVLMAAVLNFIGAATGTAVAKTIGSDIVDTTMITQQAIVAALLAAITWNLITWYAGIPSSSSHALIGGLVGAAIGEAGLRAPKYMTILNTVILPLVASPVIGFVAALIFMILLLRAVAAHTPAWVQSVFGRLQLLSSALMAYSHGGNDAQKTMGVITLALVAYGAQQDFNVPLWVILISATAMALGTASGGWRIIRTMGTRLAELRPIHGFVAETTAGIVIEIASRLGYPLSTTQVISASILGVGASRRLRAVRWNIAGSIITAWIVTIPVCVAIGWGMYQLARWLPGS
ncbi:MAG TPA: inorganic phosphate transporter [Roseiflexaceae bacterium]|jgi:PiT family inorganic phosphate transporter|nr:inorganic phosphate transporter [Roseiflexaceae bacterium]